jgi:hypothetical protein
MNQTRSKPSDGLYLRPFPCHTSLVNATPAFHHVDCLSTHFADDGHSDRWVDGPQARLALVTQIINKTLFSQRRRLPPMLPELKKDVRSQFHKTIQTAQTHLHSMQGLHFVLRHAATLTHQFRTTVAAHKRAMLQHRVSHRQLHFANPTNLRHSRHELAYTDILSPFPNHVTPFLLSFRKLLAKTTIIQALTWST